MTYMKSNLIANTPPGTSNGRTGINTCFAGEYPGRLGTAGVCGCCCVVNRVIGMDRIGRRELIN